MSQISALVMLAMVLCATCQQQPPLCEPGVFEQMPPHIKKVCLALGNSNQLSNSLNNYIKNEAAALLYKTDDMLQPNAGKRTDVDHVFLRFGRKR